METLVEGDGIMERWIFKYMGGECMKTQVMDEGFQEELIEFQDREEGLISERVNARDKRVLGDMY